MEKGILTDSLVKLCYDVMTVPSVRQLKEMIPLHKRNSIKAGITSVHSDNFLSFARVDQANVLLQQNKQLGRRKPKS